MILRRELKGSSWVISNNPLKLSVGKKLHEALQFWSLTLEPEKINPLEQDNQESSCQISYI